MLVLHISIQCKLQQMTVGNDISLCLKSSVTWEDGDDAPPADPFFVAVSLIVSASANNQLPNERTQEQVQRGFNYNSLKMLIEDFFSKVIWST